MVKSNEGSITRNGGSASVTEEALFPVLDKGLVSVEMPGASNPDYNLQVDRGVADSMTDIPGVDSFTMKSFNRYYKIFPDDEATAVLNYIFIVRPDLNMDYCVAHDSYYKNLAVQCPRVIMSLTQSYSGPNGLGAHMPDHHFIPWLVPRTVNDQLPDISLKTYDYEQPFTNFHSTYAGNANDSRSGAQMTLTFRETKKMEVTKFFDGWVRYIDGVNLGSYSPKREYCQSKILNGGVILDYATSVYQIGVLPSGSEIVFIHKTTGLFPTEVPISSWAHEGRPTENQQISITFAGGFPEAFDPSIFADFNYNAGMKGVTAAYAETAGFNRPVVGTPFITYSNESDHPRYYLRWGRMSYSY